MLESIERASLDELRAVQLERLRWSVRHTYENVTHYRRKCAAVGVHPDDLRRLEDLSRFPFTTKQDLRDHYPGQPTGVEYTLKDGAVVWEDHFYPEIVVPDGAAILADGEQGELILTSLTKEALPMIRYRTRDLAHLLPPTARPVRRIARIFGHSDGRRTERH